jgi:CheY-like chemotaxis protein
MPKRILIVDDSPGVRHLVRAHLESQPGFAICEEATDGLDGIEKAKLSKPDLIVLDLSMPKMNGLEAAATLKTFLKNIPIILFTSYVDVLPEERFRCVGIQSVVSKSWPIETLLHEIHRLVGIASAA